MIVAGVLSGTSLDGIDVAVSDVRRTEDRYAVAPLAFETVPFADDVRAALLRAAGGEPLAAADVCALHAHVGDAFGDAVRAVAAGHALALVGSHGVTLAHDGDARRTLQIGDPFRIRERAGATVAYDFRAADCAAGGHGAPLAPFLDAMLFADPAEDRVALNLGGIANVTVLRRGAAAADAVAFDTGPANLPVDTEVRARGIGMPYDRDGALAARGSADAALLAALLDDPYFAQPPPKTTGRERFGAAFVERHRAALDALSVEDALATLTALTVRTVADAVARALPAGGALVASGGGVHNRAILDGLRRALPGVRVETTAAHGIDPDAKEAVLFALLARELVAGRAANVPAATGARGPRVLGALAPHALERVVAAVRREEEA